VRPRRRGLQRTLRGLGDQSRPLLLDPGRRPHRNLGRKRSAEMLFTGEFIDAETALDWGLLNRVVPPTS
jgi:hypothetical protein